MSLRGDNPRGCICRGLVKRENATIKVFIASAGERLFQGFLICASVATEASGDLGRLGKPMVVHVELRERNGETRAFERLLALLIKIPQRRPVVGSCCPDA